MDKAEKPNSGEVSKTKVLLGAGALLLFIVGVRKTWNRPSAGGGSKAR